MKLRYRRLRLELGFTWAIARNSSDFKDNFILSLGEGGYVGWGEVAPNIRYNETADAVEKELLGLVHVELTFEGWTTLIFNNQLPACLRFGLDAALQMLRAKQAGLSLAGQLGVSELAYSYPISFTLPIMEAGEVASFFERHLLARFSILKVKVGRQSQDEMVSELGRLYTGPVLVDGNEAFTSIDELDRHITFWQKHLLLAAVEQPFASIADELAKQVKGRYPFPILADESVVHGADIEVLSECFDGINIKSQKAGSYAEALRQKREAHRLGMKVMVGCMVETSVGIWHGLHLAAGADFIDLDSMLYLKHEPAGWIEEEAGHLKPASEQSLVLEALTL